MEWGWSEREEIKSRIGMLMWVGVVIKHIRKASAVIKHARKVMGVGLVRKILTVEIQWRSKLQLMYLTQSVFDVKSARLIESLSC